MTDHDHERQRELLRQAAESLPGGVLGRHRLPDDRALVFSHGRGAHLFDAAGREFIDFTCGGGALLLFKLGSRAYNPLHKHESWCLDF